MSTTPTTPRSRDYRIIGATEDEQEFWRCHGVALSNRAYSLAPVLVHKSRVSAYCKTRYIAYDLSVTAYLRKAEISHPYGVKAWFEEHFDELSEVE